MVRVRVRLGLGLVLGFGSVGSGLVCFDWFCLAEPGLVWFGPAGSSLIKLGLDGVDSRES